MKKRKQTIFILMTLIVLSLGLLAYYTLNPTSKVSYPTFIDSMEKGKIERVEFSSDSIKFIEDGKKYSTTNPSSPTLKEELLLKGIDVVDSTITADDVMNTAFNVIFLFVFAFLIFKLISWYATTFRTVHRTGVHFSDIAGMDELKADMNNIVLSLKSKGSQEGNRKIKGIILEGPPGNGKTLFAKALAEEADMNFIATKGADFQGAVMGLGAMKVKMLFNKARRKTPCIIFIDEFDSIGERRNYAGSGIDKENNRILTTLLNEMDGFSNKSGVLVIAATNSFESLDEALVRPGRFDLKYRISNPDSATREKLVTIYSKGKTFSPELTPDVMSKMFDGLSSAAIESIINEAWIIKNQHNMDSITVECIIASAAKCREKLNVRIQRK